MSRVKPEHKSTVVQNTKTSAQSAGISETAQDRFDKQVRRQAVLRRRDERADLLAQDDRYIKGFTFHELVENFPMDWKLWDVQKYYPNSPHGRIVIVEVDLQAEDQLKLCRRQKEMLGSIGVKYLVLTDEMSENDDREALDACLNGHQQRQL